MRRVLASSFVLSAATAALGAWIPASQLKHRGASALLDCLEGAGLDPVVQGESAYAADAAPFNLRCA